MIIYRQKMYGAFPTHLGEDLIKAGKKKGFLHPDVVKKYGSVVSKSAREDTQIIRKNLKEDIDAYTKSDQKRLKGLKRDIADRKEDWNNYIESKIKYEDPKEHSKLIESLKKDIEPKRKRENREYLRQAKDSRYYDKQDIDQRNIKLNRYISWL